MRINMVNLHPTFCLLFLGVSLTQSGEIITSPPITNWGVWGRFDHCPNGTFARAFQLKTEIYKGPLIDDTAGNGVRLFCGDPLDESTPTVTSSEGSYGQWGAIFSCPPNSYINGFALRVEVNGIDDETATNNVRFYCNTDPENPLEGDGLTFGVWRDYRRCAASEALCAIQTQVEGPQGLADDSSFNNLAAECCDLPPPTTEPPSTTTAATTTTPTTTAATTTTTTAPPTTSAPAMKNYF